MGSPPELVAKHKEHSKKNALYYANVENMDNAAGRLLDYLDKNNLSSNTLVVFFSDNGSKNGSNKPLRGKKSHVWDGGIRVPGIIRWTGRIDAGQVCNTPVGAVDILPTLSRICNFKTPEEKKLDGCDISTLFSNGKLKRTTPLFWFFYRVTPSAALRDGDWSIVGHLESPPSEYSHPLTKQTTMSHIKTGELGQFELYNYKTDIAQSKDLSKEYPERFNKMKEQLIKLQKQAVAEGPTWDLSQKKKKNKRKKKKKK